MPARSQILVGGGAKSHMNMKLVLYLTDLTLKRIRIVVSAFGEGKSRIALALCFGRFLGVVALMIS
jgi:hypothetical protein